MPAAAAVLADRRETRGPGEGGRRTQDRALQPAGSAFSSAAASGRVAGTEVGTDWSGLTVRPWDGVTDPRHHERSPLAAMLSEPRWAPSGSGQVTFQLPQTRQRGT